MPGVVSGDPGQPLLGQCQDTTTTPPPPSSASPPAMSLRSMDIINLVSSPAAAESKQLTVEQLEEKNRIPTPTFNAFRTRWARLDTSRRSTTSPSTKVPATASVWLIESSEGEAGQSPAKPPKCRIPKARRASPSTDEGREMSPSLPLADPSHAPLRLGRPPRRRRRRGRAEALEEISMVVDTRLHERHRALFTDLATRIAIEERSLNSEHLVLWRRRRILREDIPEVSPFALVMFEAKDVYEALQTGNEECIHAWVREAKELIPATHPYANLLILGGKGLGHKISSKVNKRFREAVLSGAKLTPTKTSLLAWADLEQQLWRSCLENDVHPRFLDRPTDLASFILEFSKCVAWEPYASTTTTSLSFCTATSRRCGDTLSSTWQKMLEEIGRVTPEIASAIVSHYPDLNSLLSQYDILEPGFGEHLLANIPTGRRVLGPALSKRIYRILTSSNPTTMANI